MAVTLHVERRAWEERVRATWTALGDVVPVVKGNGYGLGRTRLAAAAVAFGADEVAVGTVHEVADLPPGADVTILTPALAPEVDPASRAVHTVASLGHVDELAQAGFTGSVVVELATTLRRFGVDAPALDDVLDRLATAGLALHAFGLHFPLATTNAEHAAQVASWLGRLPPDVTVHVSHVDAAELDRLRRAHPQRLRARTGTARCGTDLGTGLGHGPEQGRGDKVGLRLVADVLDVHPLAAGERAGYRQTTPGTDGHLVIASGGTAHGVQPLAPDGRSPFHHRRARLALLEPPHMHTSMLFVPDGQPLPEVGDELDLQRPLTQTWPDRIIEH